MGKHSRSRSKSSSSSGSSRSKSRSRSRSNGRSSPPPDAIRVHVGNLHQDTSKRELEECFERYGKLLEVWIARTPPCFAFISYKERDEADDAVRGMNGQYVL